MKKKIIISILAVFICLITILNVNKTKADVINEHDKYVSQEMYVSYYGTLDYNNVYFSNSCDTPIAYWNPYDKDYSVVACSGIVISSSGASIPQSSPFYKPGAQLWHIENMGSPFYDYIADIYVIPYDVNVYQVVIDTKLNYIDPIYLSDWLNYVNLAFPPNDPSNPVRIAALNAFKEPKPYTADDLQNAKDEGFDAGRLWQQGQDQNLFEFYKRQGYDEGYRDGLNNTNVSDWLSSLFTGIGSIFEIEIFPNINLGVFILIPLVFSVMLIVIKFLK